MKVGRFATTYVTGSHALKAGVEASNGRGPNGARSWYTGDVTMTFTNGVPQSVTLRIPRDHGRRLRRSRSSFVQDRWTFKRATITGGVRYDYFVGYVNDSTLPPSRWNPGAVLSRASRWSTGRTFLRASASPTICSATARRRSRRSIARYVAPESNGTAQANNPQTTIGRTDTRTWRDLNGDYTIYNPDGSVQIDELGPTSNVNFGKVIPTTATSDPATLNGWNARGVHGGVAGDRAAPADAGDRG